MLQASEESELRPGESARAHGPDVIKLPAPQTERVKMLMQALKDRQSAREFGPKKLPLHVLSNLLWTAFGVNRLQTGTLTAQSTDELHEIDVYVAMASGLYLYDARNNVLKHVLTEDASVQTSLQPFVADAPVNLIYVADYSRMVEAEERDRILYSAADAGFISQNVYLFCALEELATVMRGLVDRLALAKLMKLKPSQHVILVQSVGYRAEIH
jgi:SagB-type dehydrogenase family enzyme